MPQILIVEDEPALVTMLRYNLEKEGYRVDDAGDGEEALLRVEESIPDLVLLDWMLPRLSGLRLQTEAVKAGKSCSGSPNLGRLRGCT